MEDALKVVGAVILVVVGIAFVVAEYWVMTNHPVFWFLFW